LVVPGAVLVEVFVAGDFTGDVAGGLGLIGAGVALGGPLVELVGGAGVGEIVFSLIIASDLGALAGVEGEGLAAAGDFAFSVAYSDGGGLGVRVRVDAVFAGLGDVEGEVGRVHLKDLVLGEVAEADVERAFGEADLDGLIVEIQELEGGLGAEAQGCGADVKLGATAIADPDAIADGEGAVDVSIYPVFYAGGLERDGAGPVVEAADAAGGILRRQE